MYHNNNELLIIGYNTLIKYRDTICQITVILHIMKKKKQTI